MTSEYFGQKLDLIGLELPTKALLLLTMVTLCIIIAIVIALIKWWKGDKSWEEVQNVVKLMHVGATLSTL